MKKFYKNFIEVPNGSWIGTKDGYYDFGYKDEIILHGCCNFSYVSGRLIALKKDDIVYIYSTKIITSNQKESVEKLMQFSAYSNIAYAKIICEWYTYLIDSNCQISYTNKSHIN